VLSDRGRRQRHDELEALERRGPTAGAGGRPPRLGSLALRRPTLQSSTRAGGGESGRAVDGNADPRWSAGSCTHTSPAGETQPWWAVDVGAAARVGRVRLRNRAEASERLHHWQVRVGDSAARLDVPCGPVHEAAVSPGAWAEADCGGRQARWIGVVLDYPGSILTLCEVEVFEHQGAPGAHAAAVARRYVEEFYQARAPPWREERALYLRRAAQLFEEALELTGGAGAAGLEALYADASDLPPPPGQQDAASSAPLLRLRSQVLERIATSEDCIQRPATCCGPALTRSAGGCLSMALALAKMAGDLGRPAR
ncbi:unnamed protein product, partial [Prorocentrum cordatum]